MQCISSFNSTLTLRCLRIQDLYLTENKSLKKKTPTFLSFVSSFSCFYILSPTSGFSKVLQQKHTQKHSKYLSSLSAHIYSVFSPRAASFPRVFIEYNRIFQLEETYSNHLVQQPDDFRVDQKLKQITKGIVQMPLRH